MAKSSGTSLSAEFLLQLCLGAFFLALGVMGLGDYNSKLSGFMRFFGRNDTLNMITALVELGMGAVLLLGLFLRIGGGLAKLLGIALVGLWALYVVMTFLVNGLFEPSFLVWVYNLSWNAVILVGLWIVGRKYIAS